MLTEEQAKSIVETVRRAFAPLTCAAEIWDYGDKLRFRVLDSEGNALVTAKSIPLQEVSDPRSLNDVLSFARSRVEMKGFALAPFNDW